MAYRLQHFVGFLARVGIPVMWITQINNETKVLIPEFEGEYKIA